MNDCPHCGYVGGHEDMPASFIAEACRIAREMVALGIGTHIGVSGLVDGIMEPVREKQEEMVRFIAEHGADAWLHRNTETQG